MKLVPVHISRWRLPKTTSLAPSDPGLLPPSAKMSKCWETSPRKEPLPQKNIQNCSPSKQGMAIGWLSPSMELPSAQPNLGETFWVKSMIATLPPPHYVRPIFAKFSNHIGHLVLHYHHAAGVADGTLQEGSLSCHRTSAELRRPHGTPMFVEWGSYGGFLK